MGDGSTSVLPTVAPHIHDPLILATLASEVGLEEWRDIPGYENEYQVSNLGRVRSLDKQIRQKLNSVALKKGKTLTPRRQSKKQDHLAVKLCRNNTHEVQLVHRLVLIAFVGLEPVKPKGLHIKNDPTDNRLVNLIWGTQKQNMSHRDSDGTTAIGENNGKSKVTAKVVKEIRELRKSGLSIQKIATRYCLSKSGVRSIITRRTWAHVD